MPQATRSMCLTIGTLQLEIPDIELFYGRSLACVTANVIVIIDADDPGDGLGLANDGVKTVVVIIRTLCAGGEVDLIVTYLLVYWRQNGDLLLQPLLGFLLCLLLSSHSAPVSVIALDFVVVVKLRL